MKTWTKVVLGVVVVVGLLVTLVFWATSGITKAADDFFDSAANNEMDATYALVSKDMQRALSKEELERFLSRYALDTVSETSWSKRSISGNIGTVEGTVTMEGGIVAPVTMQFIKEDDVWKVISIDKKAVGVTQSGGNDNRRSDFSHVPIPPESEQVTMVEEATSAFAASLRDPDFRHFRSYWVDNMTLKNLEDSFASMRPNERDFRIVSIHDPQINPATKQGKDGRILISGSYDAPGLEYKFNYIFLPVSESEWKLIDFEFGMDPK